MKGKYNKIIKVIGSMMSPQEQGRPSCRELLSDFQNWSLSLNELISINKWSEETESFIINQTKEGSFYQSFVRTKFRFNSK